MSQQIWWKWMMEVITLVVHDVRNCSFALGVFPKALRQGFEMGKGEVGSICSPFQSGFDFISKVPVWSLCQGSLRGYYDVFNPGLLLSFCSAALLEGCSLTLFLQLDVEFLALARTKVIFYCRLTAVSNSTDSWCGGPICWAIWWTKNMQCTKQRHFTCTRMCAHSRSLHCVPV